MTLLSLTRALPSLFLVASAAATPAAIENDALRVELDPATGAFSVTQKDSGARWVPLAAESGVARPPGDAAAVSNIERPPGSDPALRYRVPVRLAKDAVVAATVTLVLPKGKPELRVTVEAPKDSPMQSVAYPAPLMSEAGEDWAAATQYNGGMLLPLRAGQGPRWRHGWELPFFGVIDLPRGRGYACILETPDDANTELRPAGKEKDARLAVRLSWLPICGRWSSPRRVRYRFFSEGGYVAAAKACRAYAKETGLLKTASEKRKTRPELAKLMGAPDIWGADGLKFCREARAAGIDRLLINGGFGIEDTKAIRDLGYLASCYDNYEDIMAGKGPPHGDCKIPDDAPKDAAGKPMLGWPVHLTDPKTGRTQLDPTTGKPVIKEQYYKRCSVLFEQAARRFIPADQAKHPRNARFLDVHTATGLRECYDPAHPCTRAQDRAARQALAAYAADESKLVLGGEHGTWWGVPFYDYWEGMQSGGYYSWPAGHVGMDLPRTREEIGKDYLTYGIGHFYRIPLWELIFGDCVTAYWYWGDSTGHLHQVAPEITDRHDLFDMLYGTLPLYWVNRTFGLAWSDPALRRRLLESYWQTCKLHEVTGWLELTDHRWLADDRTVQKSTFADGTFVVVNFDDKPRAFTDDGRAWQLAPRGFYARGPKVSQYRIIEAERIVTSIHTPGFWRLDAGGKDHDFGPARTAGAATIRCEPGRIAILRDAPDGQLSIRPARLADDWDADTATLVAFDDQGTRLRQLEADLAKEAILLPPGPRLELLYGRKHAAANLLLDAAHLAITPADAPQGTPLRIEAAVRNTGRLRAKKAAVSFHIDTVAPATRIGGDTLDIAPGASATAACSLETAGLDGPHTLIAVADDAGAVAELIESDNRAERPFNIRADYTRWPCRIKAVVQAGEAACEEPTVALAVDFAPLLRAAGVTGAPDPASVRVTAANPDGSPGAAVPGQFDPASGSDSRGEVAWIVPGRLHPGEARRFVILCDAARTERRRPPAGRLYDPTAATVRAPGYTAVFRQGNIEEVRSGRNHESPVFRLMFSSGETGWTQEDGDVAAMDVLANGPVRAIVRVTKRLARECEYTKTYAFHRQRFDIEARANKPWGILSRAYYLAPCTFEDDRGHRAAIDGEGDDDGVSGKAPDPKYYAAYGADWAHSCVALGKFSNVTYWDGSAMGGAGFHGGDRAGGARMSYVFHPGQDNAQFAQADHAALTRPPAVRIETERP